MAASGAKVMALRSVEFARNYGVRLHVRAALRRSRRHVDRRGGRTRAREGDHLRRHARHVRGEGAILGVPDRPGIAARVFRAARRRGREHRHDRPERLRPTGRRDISFTLPKTDLAVGRADPRATRAEIGAKGVAYDPDIAKVSLVGAGMKSHPGVAADMFEALAEARHQHRDHLDLVDPDLVRRARRATSSAPCRRSTSASELFAGGARQMAEPRIGVVGATGAVGAVTLRLLARARAIENVRAFASARSAGQSSRSARRARRRGGDARGARRRRHRPASSSPSARRRRRELVPHAVRGGAVAVDKSSAYRLEPGDPARRARGERRPRARERRHRREPELLHDPAHLRAQAAARRGRAARVRVATYQSVSGAGAQRMERLRAEPPDEHNLAMDWTWDGDETDEESKIRAETQKIMELPDLPISATTVRVPVLVGHAEAVWVELEDPLTPRAGDRAPARRRRRCSVVDVPTPGDAAQTRPGARRPHPPRPRGARTALCSSSRATTCARAPR